MKSLRITQWAGLATAISPYALSPGVAARQNNLQINRPGELVVRPGMDCLFRQKDFDDVIGMYRISGGSASNNSLLVASKPNSSTTKIKRYTPSTNSTAPQDYASSDLLTSSSTSTTSPSFAEDRYGNVYCFQGNGVPPVVLRKGDASFVNVGLAAPTVAPTVVPTGNGYFVERVDILDGGGSYWAPPAITVSGGSPTRNARLKTIIQGGSVVAVDILDGGSGFTTPPTLTVDDSAKGVGLVAYGVIGTDPGTQGFQATFITTGSVSSTVDTTKIKSVPYADISQIITTMPIAALDSSGAQNTEFASGSTVTAVDTGNRIVTVSNAYTGSTNTSKSIVVNQPTRTGSTGSLSHQYSNDPNNVTVAYVNSAGTTTSVTATYDSATSKWSALIPVTPGTNSTTGLAVTGTGAQALVQFSIFSDALSNTLTTSSTPSVGTAVTGATFFRTANTLGTGTTAGTYFYNTDDRTPDASNAGGEGPWTYDYYWGGNNWDYFACLCPAFQYKFHSRTYYMVRYTSYTPPGTFNHSHYNGIRWYYADFNVLDFSKISYRYFTGAQNEIGTSADVESKWAWASATVATLSDGTPYIDIPLQLSYKTGSTAYAQYSNYRTPTVRVFLSYCPDSWVIGGNVVQLGLYRADTQTQWWCQGIATTGKSSRPIVNFRQGGTAASASGTAAGTCTILDNGNGMESGTFFAIQFDQVNAANILLYPGTYTSDTDPNLYGYSPTAGYSGVYATNWAGMDKNPIGPAFSDEQNGGYNSARLSKTFSTNNQRFYFAATTSATTAAGSPGAVYQFPSIAIPGSGYNAGDRVSIQLRQRSNLTDPPATATFSNSYKYEFKALQITPQSATSKIVGVNVASGGTNFYGVPSTTITGGGGFGLQVSPNVSGGVVRSVNILDSGTGYTTPPLIKETSTTATLQPVLRPAMRGTYRCAYRFADWSKTQVSTSTLTLTSGSSTATCDATSAAILQPGYVIDHDFLPFYTKIVSILNKYYGAAPLCYLSNF